MAITADIIVHASRCLPRRPSSWLLPWWSSGPTTADRYPRRDLRPPASGAVPCDATVPAGNAQVASGPRVLRLGPEGSMIHHTVGPAHHRLQAGRHHGQRARVVHPPRFMMLGCSKIGIDGQLNVRLLASCNVIASDLPLVVRPGVHVHHAPVEGDV